MSAKKISFAIVVCVGSLGLNVNAALAAEQQQASATDKEDTSKRVCKSVMPTGSRFTQRVCKTAAQWQRDEDRAQRALEDSFKSMRSPNGEAQPN